MKVTLVIVLFFMVLLEGTSSNYSTQNDRDTPNGVQVKLSYADLLSSLIKVNHERVEALKKLYLLNSVTYGKNALRSNIEHRLDDYDEMEASYIRNLKHVLDEVKNAPKAPIDENEVNEILKTNNDLFVLSNSENILEPDDTNNNQIEFNKLKKVLRNRDSDNDSSEEKDNNGSKADSKSSSLEKENEKFVDEVNNNKTKERSYYIIEYGCGRGRVRCIKACKEAYRYACDIYECRSSLRSELRHSCKIECRDWFY